MRYLINPGYATINFFGKRTRVFAQIMQFNDADIKFGISMLNDFIKNSSSISKKYEKVIMDKVNEQLEPDFYDTMLISPSELEVESIFVIVDDYPMQGDGVILSVYDNTNNPKHEDEPIHVLFNSKYEWTRKINDYEDYQIQSN